VTKLHPARVALAEAAVLLVAVLAAASVIRTLPDTWSALTREHDTYASLSERDPNIVPGYDAVLPQSALKFFADHAKRGDRFYVQARPGPFMVGVDYPTAVRTLARYELLPAVEVDDPHDADVVFAVGLSPSVLGLRFERVDRKPGGYAVALVRRSR
jgi:hypothetical protein